METNFTTQSIKKGLLAKAKPYLGVTVLVSLVVFAIVTSVTNGKPSLDQQIAKKKSAYEAETAEFKEWKIEMENQLYLKKTNLCTTQALMELLEMQQIYDSGESPEKTQEKIFEYLHAHEEPCFP